MAKKDRKVDYSLQDKPIVLGKLPPKTTNLKAIEKKENKKVSSVESEIVDSNPIFVNEYFNVHTRQYHPATVKFVESQCIKLKEWADQEESLNIMDFIDHQGYSPKTFYQWCEKFPFLEETHQYAIRRLGSRREMAALTRKFDAGTVHRTLGYYHYIWRQETAALAKMKEDAAQNETKVVVIERFPELPSKTPEEVAMKIHRATADKRDYKLEGNFGKRHDTEE